MSYMTTRSGGRVYPSDIRSSDFRIEDIAEHLSKECRFTGACRGLYSVAQHSMHVSQLLKQWGHGSAAQMLGLLHDAHEAYLRDLATPIKEFMRATERLVFNGSCLYDDLCESVQHIIETKFVPREAITDSDLAALHKADLVMLATEKRDLMPFDPDPWPCLEGIEPADFTVQPLGHTWAAVRFLEMYWQLADPEGERDLAVILRESGVC